MERKYSKDECMALLRDSADANSCRMELLITGPVAVLWLVLGVIAMFFDENRLHLGYCCGGEPDCTGTLQETKLRTIVLPQI